MEYDRDRVEEKGNKPDKTDASGALYDSAYQEGASNKGNWTNFFDRSQAPDQGGNPYLQARYEKPRQREWEPPGGWQPARPNPYDRQPPNYSDRLPNGDRSGYPERSYAGDRVGFPERQPGYQMTGSEFMRNVLGVSQADGPKARGVMGEAREQAILREIEKGNIPDFLRHPKTIVVTDRAGNRAELKVMPDYLAIGSNQDFVRVPVTPLLAKAIADRYGMALPTKKVVDDVYRNADIRLSAVGLVQSRQDTNYMAGNGFYLKHDATIDRQLGGASGSDALVAGHKKDLILSRFAESNPSRLDFYGFFDANGRPIQGAGGGPHESTYVDYSHGARFISQDVVVNGRHMTYDQVLADPQLAGLLSYEGVVHANNVYRNNYRTGSSDQRYA